MEKFDIVSNIFSLIRVFHQEMRKKYCRRDTLFLAYCHEDFMIDSNSLLFGKTRHEASIFEYFKPSLF